jgi:hypothetical protein
VRKNEFFSHIRPILGVLEGKNGGELHTYVCKWKMIPVETIPEKMM